MAGKRLYIMATRKEGKGEERAGAQHTLHEHALSDFLPPARPHFLRFPSPPPPLMLPAGEHVDQAVNMRALTEPSDVNPMTNSCALWWDHHSRPPR